MTFFFEPIFLMEIDEFSVKLSHDSYLCTFWEKIYGSLRDIR